VTIQRLEAFRASLVAFSKLSKCTEIQVAALIADKELTQVYSIGVNGGPKGLQDCMCTTKGKGGCIHAEINALIKCCSPVPNKVMFVTLSPCKQCAAAIINAPGGFSTLYYLEIWKDTSGLLLLKDSGVNIIRI